MFGASKSGSAALPSDPDFEYVTLLLDGNGTNGGQNNTFLDSSTNNFTITRNGNTTQGSFSPYGSNWSNFFNSATPDFLSLPNNSCLLGANDFTLEAWIFPLDFSSVRTVFNSQTNASTAAGSSYGLILNQTTGYPESSLYVGSTYVTVTSTTAPTLNTWSHLAVVRTGSTLSLYLNGTRIGTTTAIGTSSVNAGTATYPPRIGRNGIYDPFNGYISNIRLIVGSGGYNATSTTITVPTTPLTAVTNTAFLSCQSNRFVDTSSNNHAITVNGSPSVQRFSPFEPSAPYSTSVIGGSGYFDGSGDYLTVPAGSAFAYGTGDFTVDGWFYATANSPQYGATLFAQTIGGTNYFWISLNDDTANIPPANKISFTFATTGAGTSVLSGATTFNLNTWNHFAVVRSSGSVTCYLNGVGGTPVACTQDFTNTSYVPTIGRYTHASANHFTGYLSQLRVVKGTAVYTANFTPPTSPVTAITNTSLLTNFTNASIADLAMQNNLETVGNAQVSTSVKKFGTGSIYFDGSGDFLKVPYSKAFAFAGNFTVELWINYSAHDTFGGLVACASSTNPTTGWQLIFNNANDTLTFEATSITFTTSTTLPRNQWNHVAVVRNGSSIVIYINGTNAGSGTSTNVFDSGSFSLYVGVERTPSLYITGYIDDLRITNGVARYTANFTAPTAPFPIY